MTRVVVYSSQPEQVKNLSATLMRAGGFELSPAQTTVKGLLWEMKLDPSAVALIEFGAISFDTLRQIRRESNFNIVLWAGEISAEIAFEAMGLGVRGILRRSLPAAVQIKCLREVADGRLWFERIFLDGLVAKGMVKGPEREAKLVDVLAEGLKIKKFASQMMSPSGGVKACLTRLLWKTAGVKIVPDAGLSMTPWAELDEERFEVVCD